MTDTLTDDQRKAMLESIGLKSDGLSLGAPAKPPTTIKLESTHLAPEGTDPHTMPASDIVFDEHLLDAFPDLTGQGFKHASDYVFSLYKSPGRNKERNSLLHRRITEFVGATRRSRDTGGHVKEMVKATKDDRDLAQLLTAKGITAADLIKLLEAVTTEGGNE